MRARILESAAHLLATDGPSGLSTRKIAAAAGTTTMTLYAKFGSMPDLVKAVVDEGFDRLAEEFVSADMSDDPVHDLGAIFAAYIKNARANPDLYVVMFGSASLGGYRGGPEDTQATGLHAYGHIVDAAQRAVEAGRLDPLPPFAIAAQIWTTLHGYMTLELAGYYTPPNAGIRNVLLPMMRNLIIGLGDDRDAVVASAAHWFDESLLGR